MESSFADDIDLLLESEDDETEDSETLNHDHKFTKDEIVWEIWYKAGSAKGRVKDADLNTSPPLVIAQLCVVTSMSKPRGKGVMLGLVAVSPKEKVDTKLPGHKCSVKYVRKFGKIVENRSIVESQKYRDDFHLVLQQVELVYRFQTNHIGLEMVPDGMVKSFRMFLGLDVFERCLYLEMLRNLRKGISIEENETKIVDLSQELMNKEGIGVADEVKLGNNNVEEKYVTCTDHKEVEPNIEDLNEEHRQLVAGLADSWPLEWVKRKSEKEKLKKILLMRKKSWRHEAFMDKKQHICRDFIPKLVRCSNSSFIDIFGKRKYMIDRDVRITLLETVFNKMTKKKDFDPRLTKLLTQSKDYGRDYVTLVLFPEVFISWVDSVRGCGIQEAERIFLTVGQQGEEEDRENSELTL